MQHHREDYLAEQLVGTLGTALFNAYRGGNRYRATDPNLHPRTRFSKNFFQRFSRTRTGYDERKALTAVRTFRDRWGTGGYYEAGYNTRLRERHLLAHKRQHMPRRRRRVFYGRTGRYSRMKRRYRGRYRRTGYYGRYNRAGATQELKFHDTGATDAVVATGGTVTNSLCLIAQGTTEKQRLGRKAFIRSISIRMYVRMPQQRDDADINDGEVLRMILFIDHQCNGANANVLDILETAVSSSHYNLVNKGRFTILWDKVVTINTPNSSTDGTNTVSLPAWHKYLRYYKKLNVPIEYNDTTGAITEIRSNNIAFLYIAHNGVVGIPTSTIRLRFDG